MIREAIDSIVSGRDLDTDEAATTMQEIMSGRSTSAQISAFITALRMKGESIDEILGLARTMRRNSLKVDVEGPLVDTCGTGGDSLGTFNISTAAAIVAAATGLRVAKHGNRAVSGSCGSADVLEACGVRIDLGPRAVEQCIKEIGIGFMFAPKFHPAMRFAADARREIGIRTVFNILGPLTNPAQAQHQVLGVAKEELGETMAKTLNRLGCKHVLVVHGEDGADELTLAGNTRIWEVSDNEIRIYTVHPHDLGLVRAEPHQLKGGGPEQNRDLMESILKGKPSVLSDAVALNAGAALVASDAVGNLRDGIQQAQETLHSGKPWEKIMEFSQLTQSLEMTEN